MIVAGDTVLLLALYNKVFQAAQNRGGKNGKFNNNNTSQAANEMMNTKDAGLKRNRKSKKCI